MNWGGPSAPSPAPNSNQTEGEMGTEQFLTTVSEVGHGAQQGAPVGNATNPFSGGGGVAASQVAVFRWE